MSPEPGGAELDRSRSGLPRPTEPAAAGATLPSRRRRRSLDRVGARAAPYALLLPATAVIAVVLAYPLYKLGALSLQQYGLKELLAQQGVWIGFENYSTILHDREFWHVLIRTILFTIACVSLTMIFGTLIAILLTKLGSFMRLLLTTGLVLVWAMPVVVAVSIWRWMVDYEFGVLNWLLTELHLGNFVNHDWFVDPEEGFLIIRCSWSGARSRSSRSQSTPGSHRSRASWSRRRRSTAPPAGASSSTSRCRC